MALFWVVKLFSVERLACVFHPPPRSASGLAWWHLSLAQLEHHSRPTETNSTLLEPCFNNAYTDHPGMKGTPDYWPGPLWWWVVHCGWWPRPSWPDADACPPGCWWGRAPPWFHWQPWCQTGPWRTEREYMSPYHQQQGRLREGLQAEKKKNVDFFFF